MVVGCSVVVVDCFDCFDRFDRFALLLIALFKDFDVFLLLSCESALRFVQVFDPFEGGEGVGQVCTGDVVLGVERHFVSLS